MIKKNKYLIILTSATILACLLLVYLFTRKALFQEFELTKTASIGDTIGGITAPIIGLLSIILLYKTLSKQNEAINDQREKNNIDIILMLLNQLESEYNQIYTSETISHERVKIYGHEALTKLTRAFTSNNSPLLKTSFNQYYLSDHLLLVIRSIRIIEQEILNSIKSTSLRELLLKKLDNFYYSKIDDSLKKIASFVDEHKIEIDESLQEVLDFFKERSTLIKQL